MFTLVNLRQKHFIGKDLLLTRIKKLGKGWENSSYTELGRHLGRWVKIGDTGDASAEGRVVLRKR